LRKVPGIDVMDPVVTNIRMEELQRQLMRIQPRINDAVNEEWAHDKTRHHVDALVRGRLDRPWARKDGVLEEVSWSEALDLFAGQMRNAGASVAAVAGDLLDAETMYAAKALLAQSGSALLEGRQTGLDYDVTSLGAVRFNTPLADLDTADLILLVGTNPRWEAPLVNTRLLKATRRGAKVYGIGPEVDLTYKVEWLGDDLKTLAKLPKAVADAIAGAARPVMIVGPGALAKGGLGAALKASAPFVRDGWNGFNVLHTAASRMAGLMLGYSQKGGIADLEAAKPKLVLLLGADEVAETRFAGAYKVYIGHHGDNGAKQADLALPGASYAEKHGTYVNIEGRVQRGERATFPPGDAREDWTIFRALSDLLGTPLPFDRFDQLRAAMVADTPALGQEGIVDMPWAPPTLDAKAEGALAYPIWDFYLTNAICRRSPTMRRCSEELLHGQAYAEAAE
jgi:NADH-quinone oxidoreductase subunit G